MIIKSGKRWTRLVRKGSNTIGEGKCKYIWVLYKWGSGTVGNYNEGRDK